MRKKYTVNKKKNGSEPQRKILVIKLGDRLCRQREISEICQNQKPNNQDYDSYGMESSTGKQLSLETTE